MEKASGIIFIIYVNNYLRAKAKVYRSIYSKNNFLHATDPRFQSWIIKNSTNKAVIAYYDIYRIYSYKYSYQNPPNFYSEKTEIHTNDFNTFL